MGKKDEPDKMPNEGPETKKIGKGSYEQTTYASTQPPNVTVIEMMPSSVMICPYCGYTVSPLVSYEPSFMAWMMCIMVSLLLLPFFFIGFLIGYCILVADGMQEPRYVCPICGNTIGIVR